MTDRLLIIVDMQNDFISGVLGTPEAQAIVEKVVAKKNNHEGPILFTADTHKHDYLSTQEGQKLPIEHCMLGSSGWRIHPLLYSYNDHKYHVVCKSTFGSFTLVDYIREWYLKDIKSIELVGVCTDICVISNAIILRNAFPELEIYVDSSCCAGVTPESHRNALEAMKMCQINVI